MTKPKYNISDLNKILKNLDSDPDSARSEPTLKDQIKELKDHLDVIEGDINSEMKKNLNSIIQITAIFVALFTFISIEIKFFSVPFGPFVLVGLSLILMGALLFFLFFLDKIINKKESYNFIMGSVIVIISGALIVNFGFVQSNKYIFIDGNDSSRYILINQNQKDSYTQNIENQINQASSTATNSLNEFKNCAKESIADHDYVIKECYR